MTSTPEKSPAVSSADKAALWVTYINIVLYALCYQLQRPVEPFLIESLSKGENAETVSQTYGNLQAFFSTVQTIGSPLVGILLDRVGIRKASALVFLSSALSYAILASASDLNLLFLSKVPTALQHAFLIAQATAATSTGGDSVARAAALGRMTTGRQIIFYIVFFCNMLYDTVLTLCILIYLHGTAYTIGATLGPALGGYLAGNGDFYISAKMAVFGSLVSVALSLFYLPDVAETSSSSSSTDAATPGLKRKRSFVDELRHSGEIALRSSLWPLLMVKVLGGVTSSMHSTALPMVLTQNIGFDPSQLGLSMSGSMFAVAAFGAVAMAPLTKWLGPAGMTQTGLLLRAGMGGLLAAVVASGTGNTQMLLMQVVGVSILHALASHVLATGLTTQTTGAVDKQEQGALLGLEHGLFSLARIGGSPMGTALMGWGGGLWSVETVCGVMDIALVASLVATMSRTSKRKST
jgi:OCT family organic cation transporter-like MFS transporter 18